jgi:hypothetical protein
MQMPAWPARLPSRPFRTRASALLSTTGYRGRLLDLKTVRLSPVLVPKKLVNKLHIKTLFHPGNNSTITRNNAAQGRTVCQYLRNF